MLANHLIKSVAYTQPSSVDVLRALGARVGDLDRLVAIISDAKTEFGWCVAAGDGGGSGSDGGDCFIKIAPGMWSASNGAAIKAMSYKKPPHWVVVHKRFNSGENIEAIAVTGGARGTLCVVCAWCAIRGAWCVVRSAWCVVRGAWCVVRGAWCT